MSQHRPVSFLVLGSSLFAASCVTVYAQPGRANPPPGLPPVPMEMAQQTEGVAPEGEAVTEGPAQPELGDAEQGEVAAPPEGAPVYPPQRMGRPGWGPRGGMGDPEKQGPTDHQRVIGHWGVEARSLGTLQTSPNNPDPVCTNNPAGCRDVRVTSVGVRRWITEHYAYSAGVAVAVGGGSTKGQGSWDTHVGIGPTAGAFFLLSQWKHLAISATPQLGLLYFAPSGSGNKTFSLDVQGKVEAELQLGFIGLPGFAVGTDAGLGVRYMNVSNDGNDAGGYSRWGLSTVGTSTPWGMVTNAFLRFYL